MCLLDYDDYKAANERMDKAYADKRKWNKMALVNIAQAGERDRAVYHELHVGRARRFLARERNLLADLGRGNEVLRLRGESFSDIADYLIAGSYNVADPYMCLLDFDDYEKAGMRCSACVTL